MGISLHLMSDGLGHQRNSRLFCPSTLEMEKSRNLLSVRSKNVNKCLFKLSEICRGLRFAKASYADLYMNLKHILSPPSMWERNYTPRDGGEGGCNIIRLS